MDYNLELQPEKNNQFDDLKVFKLWKDTEALYFLDHFGFEKYYDKRETHIQSKEKKLVDLLEIQLKEIFDPDGFGLQYKTRGNQRIGQDIDPYE